MAVLRASAEDKGEELDYGAVTRGVSAGDTGLPNDTLLIAFAEAILGPEAPKLNDAREAIAIRMGGAALVDSAAVAALFNAIDRVADSTGAQVEDWKLAETAELRSAIGIDAFAANKAAIDAATSTEHAAE